MSNPKVRILVSKEDRLMRILVDRRAPIDSLNRRLGKNVETFAYPGPPSLVAGPDLALWSGGRRSQSRIVSPIIHSYLGRTI